MLRVAIVGFGALGQELARRLAAEEDLAVTQVVTTPKSLDSAREMVGALAPRAAARTKLDLLAECRPDLVVECAGHGAILAHVVPALQAGVRCIVASIGALANPGVLDQLEGAARHGATRVQLVSGAIGGIDALDAAGVGGLERVLYTGRKPPLGWQGTPAEQVCNLARLETARVVFEGSAREAARAFPKNANVAATVALAGLGLDRTEVQLIADPDVERNVHRVESWGTFGRMELHMENLTLASNPKTSAQTVFSLVRAVKSTTASIYF